MRRLKWTQRTLVDVTRPSYKSHPVLFVFEMMSLNATHLELTGWGWMLEEQLFLVERAPVWTVGKAKGRQCFNIPPDSHQTSPDINGNIFCHRELYLIHEHLCMTNYSAAVQLSQNLPRSHSTSPHNIIIIGFCCYFVMKKPMKKEVKCYFFVNSKDNTMCMCFVCVLFTCLAGWGRLSGRVLSRSILPSDCTPPWFEPRWQPAGAWWR